MTTASKVTLCRVILVPVFMVLLLLGYTIIALIIFVVASCTDFVDGYIARRYNQTSNFGKFLDPLVDKLLVMSCMVVFIQWGRMPAWAVMLVLTREFAVTGLRLVAVEGGRVIAAGWLGKIKTVCTMIGLGLMLLLPGPELMDWIVTAVIVLTTVVSGIEYFCENWSVLDTKK